MKPTKHPAAARPFLQMRDPALLRSLKTGMVETDTVPARARVRRLLQSLWGGEGLAARGRRAASWSALGVGSNYVIKLGSNLALTRLLSPEIFGLMALAQVFMQGMNMLSDVGTRASVIRSDRGDDPEFLNTAWTVQILRGLILGALSCLLAWPVSLIYDQPVLFPLICALSVTMVFSGFVSISASLASRKLMMKRVILAGVVMQIMVTLVTVLAAWLLESIWALVIGGVFGSALYLVMTHVVLPPFPHRFRLEGPAVRELVTFGRWILLGTAFTFLANQGQQAIYGLLLPVEILGKIAIAVLIASVPLQFFTHILQQVIFPSFSEVRRERPHDVPRVLRKVRLTVIFTFLPIMFLVSGFAQPVIDLLYDDRYAMAGIFLALIPLNNAISILANPYQQLLLADGASHLHAFLMALAAVFTIGGIVLGYQLYGILGSVAFVGLAFALHFLANSVIASRRGYGTGLLDLAALGLIGIFYAYVLATLDIPPELLAN
jgi:O-antigen/teichoic acid export membrane protein